MFWINFHQIFACCNPGKLDDSSAHVLSWLYDWASQHELYLAGWLLTRYWNVLMERRAALAITVIYEDISNSYLLTL